MHVFHVQRSIILTQTIFDRIAEYRLLHSGKKLINISLSLFIVLRQLLWKVDLFVFWFVPNVILIGMPIFVMHDLVGSKPNFIYWLNSTSSEGIPAWAV